jgi:hypothetical protein
MKELLKISNDQVLIIKTMCSDSNLYLGLFENYIDILEKLNNHVLSSYKETIDINVINQLERINYYKMLTDSGKLLNLYIDLLYSSVNIDRDKDNVEIYISNQFKKYLLLHCSRKAANKTLIPCFNSYIDKLRQYKSKILSIISNNSGFVPHSLSIIIDLLMKNLQGIDCRNEFCKMIYQTTIHNNDKYNFQQAYIGHIKDLKYIDQIGKQNTSLLALIYNLIDNKEIFHDPSLIQERNILIKTYKAQFSEAFRWDDDYINIQLKSFKRMAHQMIVISNKQIENVSLFNSNIVMLLGIRDLYHKISDQFGNIQDNINEILNNLPTDPVIIHSYIPDYELSVIKSINDIKFLSSFVVRSKLHYKSGASMQFKDEMNKQYYHDKIRQLLSNDIRLIKYYVILANSTFDDNGKFIKPPTNNLIQNISMMLWLDLYIEDNRTDICNNYVRYIQDEYQSMNINDLFCMAKLLKIDLRIFTETKTYTSINYPTKNNIKIWLYQNNLYNWQVLEAMD